MTIRAVLWDFGGVILSSPFEAFNRYEDEIGVPRDFIRGLNATNPDDNAWAKFERSEVSVDEFAELFEAEAAAGGHELSGHRVLGLLGGEVRPAMVSALERINEDYITACLTNNMPTGRGPGMSGDEGRANRVGGIMGIFDAVIESSKIGVRKPDPKFYRIACDTIGITPEEAVFLDDLGVNLKPARQMGMTTIKVVDPHEALVELGSVLEIELIDRDR